MVRFGYRKITPVEVISTTEGGRNGARWRQGGQLNKRATIRKQRGHHEDLDEGRGFKAGEKKTPQCYFPPDQLDIILTHACACETVKN